MGFVEEMVTKLTESGHSDGQAAFGSKGVRDKVGPQQEKNIWLTLMDHLSRFVLLKLGQFQ